MADLNELQSAQTVKIVGSDVSGVEQTPIKSTGSGALHTNLRDSAGTEIGTTTDPLIMRSVNDLVPQEFDEVEITAVNGSNDPTTIVYRKSTSTVATLTIVYDGLGDIQKVSRS